MKSKTLLVSLFLFCVFFEAQAETIRPTTVEKTEVTEIINLSLKDTPLEQVFKHIESQINKRFIYRSDQNFLQEKIGLNINNASLSEVLMELEKIAPLEFQISGDGILIRKKATQTKDQVDRDISGTVMGSGMPIPGANVFIEGTNIGTVTDFDGNFNLRVPVNAETLTVTYVGYKNATVDISGKTVVTITLEEDTNTLNEVVVVGYGSKKKANLTGSVDNISGERLAALQVNTIGEALQGQLPGVYVDIADGKPGRSASFNIRGHTSINGGSPLIVIDGVQQTSSALNRIPPQNIESISVLKDAASTAIYGARASYGVILVTTKKGAAGEMKIDFSSSIGFSTPTIVPEIYDNPVDYLEINENEFNGNIGQSYWTDAQVEYPYLVAQDPSLPYAQVTEVGGRPTLLTGGVVYNYYKEWFNKYSPKRNHRLSFSGGTDKLQYYISGDYNYEEGSIKFKPEEVNRYTLQSNLKYDLSDKVSIFNYTTLGKRADDLPNTYLYGFTSNIYRLIENSWPMMPEYVEVDGEQVPTDLGFYREFVTNQSGIEEDTHSAKSTLGMEFSLLNDDLKIRVDGTYHYDNTEKLRWWDNTGPYLSNSFNNRNIVLPVYSDAGPPKIYRSQWRTIYTNLNAYATYTKSLKNHNFSIMGGYNQERNDYLYMYAERLDPMSVEQNSLNLATGNPTVRDDDDRNSSRSFFSRLNYNWQEKYLLEINGSYFLSSKFSKDNRGHGFIAGSGAWRISEEDFFQPLKNVVNDLKIRGSYGTIGNANIGSYDYLPILNVNQSSYTLEGSRVVYATAPSPKSDNFTWETVETMGLGLDFGAFNNRLTGSLDIYERSTRNMLANYRSLPSVFGAAVPKENIATLRNRGWEFSIGWNDYLNLNNSDFNYSVRFNISDYKSVITDYYNPTNYLQDYYVGQELGEIWGLTTLGYFQTDEEAKNGALLTTDSYRAHAAAGTIKFDDKNDDGVISWGDRTLENPGDYRIIGNSTPRYQYGLNLSANWKGFDLNAFFRGVGKRDIYPGSESVNFWGPYNRKYQVMIKHAVENRWTPENPDAYFPRPQGYLALGGNDLGQAQTKYLQDASYLRLKNLTIGYTFSDFQRIPLDSVRIYFTGQNLWEWTNLHHSLDPEGLIKDPDANASRVGLGTSYPIQRVYSFGIQVQL